MQPLVPIDRRLDNRDSIHVSIGRWLEAFARRQGFEAVVVADADGILVASSNAGAQAEFLAALAPLRPELRRSIVGNLDVIAEPITLLGSPFFVCGIRKSQSANLEEALPGVDRILAA